MTSHVFYDDSICLDIRYLIVAETFDYEDPEDAAAPYGIGCLLEVGHTPQRTSWAYATKARRDEAFERLTAQHQAWMAQVHSCEEEDD